MEVQLSSKQTRYFDYQCARFSYTGTTFSSTFTDMPSDCDVLLKMSGGLTEAVGLERLEMYGENFIRVNVPNIFMAFAIEFSGFFYIYQFFILWVFFYWSYDYMGFIHGSMVLLSGIIRLFIKRSSELKIKSMAESNTRCNVLRNGKWREVNSLDLVPADVIKVGSNMVSPADSVVISGNCIVDEAQLTGEAMPVQKFTIAQKYEKMKGGKKNTLFAGTTVLESQAAPGEEHVLALVIDVGAHTEKGKLVSGILFAAPANFVFDEHLKFVFFVLFCWMIVALLIINSIAATVWPVTGLYFLFIASQVFPPLLPAVLVLAQSFSAGRLRLQNIFCVDLSRVTIAGKVRVFCFDKTGTLTTDGLAFDGLLPAANKQFSAIVKDSLPALLSQAIGCCHTVGKLGASFVGNPVDVEMFKKSGWSFSAHDDGAIYTKSGTTIKVLKQHEFDHDRMSMAVVVLINEEVHVFVKGSFEAVQKLSNPDSLPADYNEQAQNLAASGCYTLGIAHKNLGKIDPAVARALPRAEVESGNDCIALLMFRNNLKPDTADAIAVLKEGTVRPVMITGDTALTGVFIARKCGMVNKSATVVLGELVKKAGDDEAYAAGNTVKDIVWTEIDTDTNQKKGIVSLDDFMSTMDNINVSVGDDMKAPLSGASRNYELAMTGAVFDVLNAEGNIIRKVLPKCRVFARMTPVNKVECVQLHMEKNITAMCGDGGNDCGALRAAHVGIAMSEGEASIVSPFSTSDKSVFAAVTVLREGRCCLSTSFYAYDFILMYGESIVLAKLFYLYFGCQLAEWVWIFFEGMITPALGMSLSLAKPAAKLAPRRPTARLLGLETTSSVIGILLINLVFMFVSYVILFNQEFYACNEWDSSKVDQGKWWLLADNYEGELIGLLVMSQVLNAALVGNFSAGYRQNWCFNWVFVLLWTISYVIVALITLLDPNPVGCYMRFNCGDPDVLVSLGYDYAAGVTWTGDGYLAISGHNVFPTYFRWIVWGLGLGNLVIVVIFVRFIILGPVRTYLRANHGTARVQEC
jgi:cation-transporting ATPase 13A3/4/5